MKKSVTLLLSLLFTIGIRAQTAPDFTITGTDGQIHHLYADYLNKGKTVLLEIMFTTCPPCNSFGPFMEPMYEAWGAGQYDVEFFSLSNQSFDNNSQVLTWLTGHGATFPGAGNNGGALTAVQPYVNGQFGPFFGTPAFVVIAPGGTVQFNVGFGMLGQAKVDAISAAISITGAQYPPVNVGIEGIVKTPPGSPVGKVKLSVLPDYPAVFTTKSGGTFNLNLPLQPGTTYTLRAEKDINAGNGITTFDMVLISKHILGTTILTSPYQLIAADLNGNGTIATSDLVVGRKVILGIETTFPGNTSWRFVKAGCDPFSMPPPCPLDDVLTFTTNDVMTGLSIIGIKIGDINYSADPSNLTGGDDKMALASFSFSDKNRWMEAGKTVEVVVTASDLEATAGVIEAKGVLVDFEEFTPGFTLKNYQETEPGKFSLTIQRPTQLSARLPAGQQLFRLVFQVNRNMKLGEALRLN